MNNSTKLTPIFTNAPVRDRVAFIIANDKGQVRALYPGQATPKGFAPIGTLTAGGDFSTMVTYRPQVPSLEWLYEIQTRMRIQAPLKEASIGSYQDWSDPDTWPGASQGSGIRRRVLQWWQLELTPAERNVLIPPIVEGIISDLENGQGILDAWPAYADTTCLDSLRELLFN